MAKGIFNYIYELVPSSFKKFLKIYKKDNPNIVLKQVKNAIYAFHKGAKEYEWKYFKDDYELFIDEPIGNHFFKKFLKKKRG